MNVQPREINEIDNAPGVVSAYLSTPTPMQVTRRGYYNELFGQVAQEQVHDILATFRPALPETMVEFDKAGRGDAINHDLYGYDPERQLAVVQVRHAFRARRNGYLNVRKGYYLVGYTETGAPFRHPVSGHAIQAAARNDGNDPAEVVRAAERWIFQVTSRQYRHAVRQGDVLMFRARGTPGDTAEHVGSRCTVMGTHEIRATEIRQDARGELWAWDPAVYHLEHDHAPVYADTVDHWYVIRPGREQDAWDFAQRLGD